jgi:hypothetical protein
MIKNIFLRIGLIFNLFLFLNTTLFSYISYSVLNENGKALFFALASFMHFHILLWCGNQIKTEQDNLKNR